MITPNTYRASIEAASLDFEAVHRLAGVVIPPVVVVLSFNGCQVDRVSVFEVRVFEHFDNFGRSVVSLKLGVVDGFFLGVFDAVGVDCYTDNVGQDSAVFVIHTISR